MPQLDLGIYFFEFFFNFIFFWSLYFFNAKFIFPIINKSIKLREYKLKKFDLSIFKVNFNFLIDYTNLNKNLFSQFYLILLNTFLIKIKFLNNINLKFYYLKFNSIFSKKYFLNYLNKNFFISVLLK